jgi:hypothetical protein
MKQGNLSLIEFSLQEMLKEILWRVSLKLRYMEKRALDKMQWKENEVFDFSYSVKQMTDCTR